jgi:hypothetical protein
MNSFKFIKLCQGTKIPIVGERFIEAKPLKTIDTKKYNIGLVAGPSNLIILDIDVKNGGYNEWGNFLENYFEPETLQQKTPNGGFHYFFLHTSPNYDPERVALIERLKNKSGYRNVGIDIRIGNGYVAFNPSSIMVDGKLKSYTIFNETQPTEMPLTLLKWLLEFEDQTKLAINTNLVIVNDLTVIKKLLVETFTDVSSKTWFEVTTALKSLIHKFNKIDEKKLKNIWNSWSKKQLNYNKKNNYKIWDSITADINFNYLITQHNKNNFTKEELLAKDSPKIPTLESFKPMDKLTTNVKTIEMHNKYIFDALYNSTQFDFNLFQNNDTIVIKSTTGTGKTSNTANHIKKYMEDKPNLKVLSLIDRVCLSYQHVDSFQKAGLKMVSYQDENKNLEDDNIIICLNSLMLYSKYDKEFFSNYVVYIDEITSFLNSLTHNDTMNNVLKMVYVVLMRIINNCHKIIVSDATITNNTFTLLEKRKEETKVFIINSFRKYEGVRAYKMNDENEFLLKLHEHVTQKKYFLFGCDSKTVIDNFYTQLNTENKIKFTSDKRIEIKDASTEFKDKFIVYSPTITTGVDFSIDKAQDVFLYINGKSITPDASFQQLSRTRNINNVYFYINETKSKIAEYNTLEDVHKSFKEIASTHYKINNLCGTVTDDDYGFVFNENTFFKLFTYNEYIKDIFNTNKEQHFLNILDDNKFDVIYVGVTEKLDKELKQEMVETVLSETMEKYMKTVAGKEIDEIFKKRLDFLNIDIKNEDLAFEYCDIIIDKFALNDYLNFIRLLKDESYIKRKLFSEKFKITEYKAVYTNYYKISLLGQLEKAMNIKRYQFEKLETDISFQIPQDLMKKINSSFRCKETPETFNEAIQYYVKKITHLVSKNIPFIDSVQIQLGSERKTHYSINNITFLKFLRLYRLSICEQINLVKSPIIEELYDLLIEQEREINKINENKVDIIDVLECPDSIIVKLTKFPTCPCIGGSDINHNCLDVLY